MRNFAITIVIVAVLGLLAMGTKPSNSECVDRVVSQYTGTDLVNTFLPKAGSTLYMVEDCFFYKQITNRITGKIVGYGLFTQVIITN